MASQPGKKRGIIILIAAICIIITQLLQMAALNDINRGSEPDYTSEWMMVQIGFILTSIFSVLLIVVGLFFFRSGES